MPTKVENQKRREQIIKMVGEGNTYKAVAQKFGVTKARVGQVVKTSDVDSDVDLAINRSKRKMDKLYALAQKIEREFQKGTSNTEIKEKFNLSGTILTDLLEVDIDLRSTRNKDAKKRNKTCLRLYKKGMTAYEILEQVPELSYSMQVYAAISKANDGHLPERRNSRVRYSEALHKQILKLKKRNTFVNVHQLLVDAGWTNCNGTPLKVETVIAYYYKK